MSQPSENAGLTAMADAMVASGSLSREAATQMLAVDRGEASAGAAWGGETKSSEAPGSLAQAGRGVTAPGGTAAANAPAAPGADTAPAGESIRDAAQMPGKPLAEIDIDPLFAPPASPEGYKFEMHPATKIAIDEVRTVREWCHAARLPHAIAQSLYTEVERLAQGGRAFAATVEQREQAALHTVADLRRAWGERTDAMLAAGRRLIAEVGQAHPRLIGFLERSGAGSHPVVVRQIAEHAARLYGGTGHVAPLRDAEHAAPLRDARAKDAQGGRQ